MLAPTGNSPTGFQLRWPCKPKILLPRSSFHPVSLIKFIVYPDCHLHISLFTLFFVALTLADVACGLSCYLHPQK